MLWVKTFHLLFVMLWMAGIIYPPKILYVLSKAGRPVNRLIDGLSWRESCMDL